MKNILWTAFFLLTLVSFTTMASASLDDSVQPDLINKIILKKSNENYDNQLNDYFQEHSKALITVAMAKKLEPGTKVFLEGQIMEKLTPEHKYIFKDITGDIELRIDNKDLGDHKIHNNATYIIWGELVNMNNKLEVDVSKLVEE